MAKLEKSREKPTKLITFIGGMSTMTTIVSIPGGLDANGHIRFWDQYTFYAFLQRRLSFSLWRITVSFPVSLMNLSPKPRRSSQCNQHSSLLKSFSGSPPPVLFRPTSLHFS
ncbi:unnamed protein product [Microthlaspi erraticum]|uniref:Uncharacterized protein n=1 Tax=Microthlaspi erraticum TaxID=1685480 RepID=A0A6D2KBD6_9BRAS|nr:unnamed protein product [Microthlaspi erraticum]